MIIEGLELHKRQKEIFDDIVSSNSKYFIINASRQSGKTVNSMELCRYFSLTKSNQVILFVTPTYSLGQTIFTGLVDSFKNIPVIKAINKSKLIIEFKNDSKIIFKSAERYDNIRGMSADYIFMDEFAYFKIGAFEAIKMVIAAKINSKVIITSTPRGRNLFYDLAMLGQSDNDRYKYYFMHYLDNPAYDLNEVEDAKNVLPADIYNAEYEGIFNENGGTVFKNVSSSQLITNWIDPIAGNKYFAGLDIGKEDSTVLTIMDKVGNVVFIKSVKQKSYSDIINDLIPILKKYNPIVYVEVTGVGSVFYDILIKSYSNLRVWNTSNQSKTEIIELLVNSLSTNAIKIPTKELCKELDFEFSVFTYEYSPKTRMVRYMAQVPHHDDMIISLAIANKCRIDNSRGFVMTAGTPSVFRK